ncbi:hypothetical protein BD779DRAFT_1471493 [Infundibulicybe gibba]|nr:hypothetical protein BD779DRAFT_1471493 [Infundibulicybe gibba]
MQQSDHQPATHPPVTRIPPMESQQGGDGREILRPFDDELINPRLRSARASQPPDSPQQAAPVRPFAGEMQQPTSRAQPPAVASQSLLTQAQPPTVVPSEQPPVMEPTARPGCNRPWSRAPLITQAQPPTIEPPAAQPPVIQPSATGPPGLPSPAAQVQPTEPRPPTTQAEPPSTEPHVSTAQTQPPVMEPRLPAAPVQAPPVGPSPVTAQLQPATGSKNVGLAQGRGQRDRKATSKVVTPADRAISTSGAVGK